MKKSRLNSELSSKFKESLGSFSEWVDQDNLKSTTTTIMSVVEEFLPVIEDALEKGYTVEQIVRHINDKMKPYDFELTVVGLRSTIWRVKKKNTKQRKPSKRIENAALDGSADKSKNNEKHDIEKSEAGNTFSESNAKPDAEVVAVVKPDKVNVADTSVSEIGKKNNTIKKDLDTDKSASRGGGAQSENSNTSSVIEKDTEGDQPKVQIFTDLKARRTQLFGNKKTPEF
jgi:hypothetical protein